MSICSETLLPQSPHFISLSHGVIWEQPPSRHLYKHIQNSQRRYRYTSPSLRLFNLVISILHRLRPFPFPVEVPPLSFHGGASILPCYYFLDYTTLYRVSPPKYDPYSSDLSEGWLIRVLELNPNHFLLSDPLLSSKPEYTLGYVRP